MFRSVAVRSPGDRPLTGSARHTLPELTPAYRRQQVTYRVLSPISQSSSKANRPLARGTSRMFGHFCSRRRRSRSRRLSRLSRYSGRLSDLSRRSSRFVNSSRPQSSNAVSSRQRIFAGRLRIRVLAVDHDALVRGVVHDLAPDPAPVVFYRRRGSTRARSMRHRSRCRLRRGRSRRCPARSFRHVLVQLHVLYSDREVVAQKLD